MGEWRKICKKWIIRFLKQNHNIWIGDLFLEWDREAVAVIIHKSKTQYHIETMKWNLSVCLLFLFLPNQKNIVTFIANIWANLRLYFYYMITSQSYLMISTRDENDKQNKRRETFPDKANLEYIRSVTQRIAILGFKSNTHFSPWKDIMSDRFLQNFAKIYVFSAYFK